MMFWRKKKNGKEQEQEERDDRLLHREGEPDLEPETGTDPELSEDVEHELEENESEIIDEMDETPIPEARPTEISEDDDSDNEDETGEREEEGGWLSRLTQGLSKSSNRLSQGIEDIFTKSRLDQDAVDALEEVLITSDLGPKTAARLAEEIAKDRFGKDVSKDEIGEVLADKVDHILEPIARPLETKKPENGPRVILVCGVNGVGKTTTIGKLAHQLHYRLGKKVMMAAGDTFRAAALEQLQVWAHRTSSTLIKKDIGADAAALAYEAYEEAVKEGVDILLIDTAGRLHNKSNLMAELEKIVRVLKKHDESLPHACLLVLDATTGQNAHAQVEAFREAVNVTGLIVTKLDGSAKGGVVVSLADAFKLPIHAVGVGEQVEDLQPFHPREYARSLVGLKS